MKDRLMIYKEVCKSLGDDDEVKGIKILFNGVIDLNNARLKHPSEEWKMGGKQGAMDALREESSELVHAILYESDERIDAEAHNVISVAIRILNREWE